MKEGTIPHEEVNAAIAEAPKTLLFGWQNRARQGLRVGDQPLRRLHVAHDQVRFFYSALHQLPEFFFEALIESKVTVTLVMDCDLLAFRDARNHQAIHVGLARRTIYLPQGLLAAVHRNGYDYWSLAQILIAEGWKLLDYALLVALVEAGLRRQFTHLTSMGYSAFRHVLREHNRHRSNYKSPSLLDRQHRCGQPLPINEAEEFVQLYEERFLRLMRLNYKGTPTTADELAHRLYDEYQEDLWARRKLKELAEEFQFPTLFLLDRDVVHPLARQRAENAGQDPSPRNMDEARHDFADELRFGHHRDGAVERLVRAARRFGAEGAEGLLREVCATLFTTGKTDEDLEERIQGLLAARTTRPLDLQVNFRRGLALARCAAVLRFYAQVRAGERRLHLEDLEWIRGLLIGLAAAKARAGDLSQHMVIAAMEKVEELFAQLKVLLAREAGALLGRPIAGDELESPAVQEGLDAATRAAGASIAGCLDLPDDFRKNVLDDFGPQPQSPPAGAPPDDVVGQVSQVLALLPPRPHAASSGGATALRRALRAFEQLRRRHPDDPEQFAWLAMVLVRLDRAENSGQLLDQIRAMGLQAVGQRRAVRERAASGRIVDKVVYSPGLLRVIDEEGWEGSEIARRAADLVRELEGEEVLEPLREEAKATDRG
jgi:hypothetical protein